DRHTEPGGALRGARVRLAIVGALLACAVVSALPAQIIPGRPPIRAGAMQPVRDTTKDSLAVIKWPAPDSAQQVLLAKRGYIITRYQGDTAYFINSDTARVLDLLAAGKRRAIVDRDSQLVVSDSGIYYSEATRHVPTGGHYVLSSPGTGQADIKGIGRVDYSLADRSARITRAHLPVNNGQMWYMDVVLAQVMADTANAKSSTIWVRG